MDVTFQPIWTPLGTYEERKRYFSGKHKQYGFKTQCIHDRTGRVVHVISGVVGSVHDLTIARQSIENVRFLLCLPPLILQIRQFLDADVEDEMEDEPWSILVDSGYQGLQRLVRAIMPYKRRPGRDFTRDQRVHNRLLAHHRVVCEQFYGRLKAKWRIMTSKYRNDRDEYEDYSSCVAP